MSLKQVTLELCSSNIHLSPYVFWASDKCKRNHTIQLEYKKNFFHFLMSTYFFLSKSQIHFTILQLPEFSRETVHYVGKIFSTHLLGRFRWRKKILLFWEQASSAFLCELLCFFFINFPRNFLNEYGNQPLYFLPFCSRSDFEWQHMKMYNSSELSSTLICKWFASTYRNEIDIPAARRNMKIHEGKL